MASIVGAISGGGGSGVGFSARSANILNPATIAQADEQYANVKTGLQQQQQFLQAVQAQNGLGNQSSVFNQLQGVANGTGPNPAQTALANATGANVANQAAMAAGQRGAGQNVGMMQRQAANQGSAIQQNAAGQAANMQANQSLNALNQMGGLATNQANQQANATQGYSNSAQNAQGNILGAIANQNNANVGMQSNMNNANAGMQGQIAGMQGQAAAGAMGGIGSAMQMIPGGMKSMFGGGGGGSPADFTSSMGMDSMGGGGAGMGETAAMAGNMMAAQGGMVPKRYEDGGMVDQSGMTPLQQSQGPQSAIGKSMVGGYDPMSAVNAPIMVAPAAPKGMGMGPSAAPEGEKPKEDDKKGQFNLGGAAKGAMSGASMGTMILPGWGTAIGAIGGGLIGAFNAEGGMVPSLVSPGEKYLPPKDVEKVKQGAKPLDVGEKIPGKPKFKGNNYANDTVPKQLESGGIVIPNSVMQSKDAAKKAADFVAAVLKRQSLKKGK